MNQSQRPPTIIQHFDENNDDNNNNNNNDENGDDDDENAAAAAVIAANSAAAGDGEGVWTPDIEQCFREALLLFPPCGRRKHVLQEEGVGGGKMYGRNELIARHIMMRTGKSRSRKQVSSHIQVLARRKAKVEAAAALAAASAAGVGDSGNGGGDGTRAAVALQSTANTHCSSSSYPTPAPTFNQTAGSYQDSRHQSAPASQAAVFGDVWLDREVVAAKLRLVEFSAFIEQRLCSDQLHQINHCQHEQPTYLDDQHQQHQIPLATNLQFNQANSFNFRTSHHHNHHHPATMTTVAGCIDQDSQQQQHQSPGTAYLHSPCQNQTIQLSQSHRTPLVIRHNLVHIDFHTNESRVMRKLDAIDINLLQEKFPDLCGNEGLFQRGGADSFYLIKFWTNLSSNNFNYTKFSQIDDQNSFFGFSNQFEAYDATLFNEIVCSTKVFSYGLQVVERVEKLSGAYTTTNGRLVFESLRSPMCEFVVHFIRRLKNLSRQRYINNVLENFTVLQVITSEHTSEILLCLAYVFEASIDDNTNIRHHVYKLTKD